VPQALRPTVTAPAQAVSGSHATAPSVPHGMPLPWRAIWSRFHRAMVGTFYRAASPEIRRLVDSASRITVGAGSCILEKR